MTTQEQFEDEGDLHLASRPEDDGTFQLFFIDRIGCTVKCGYVHGDAAADVRRKLADP